MQAPCSECGRPFSEHDRHIRFTLPDPVIASNRRVGSDGFWMSHETPADSVMMQVSGVGAFVRALAPVQLAGGYSITFGVWVGITPDELQRTFGLWWDPGYPGLELEGVLANEIPPWEVLTAPVLLAVRNPDFTPYCESSSHPAFARILSDVWPHEVVLAANIA